MYNFVKKYGYLIRYIVCSLTLDVIDVTDSYILNYFIISPIISFILWKTSFYTSKLIIYHKLGIDNSTIGSLGYTVSYILYVIILAIILVILSKLKIIPIITNFDINLFNWIISYFTNIFTETINTMIENLNTV